MLYRKLLNQASVVLAEVGQAIPELRCSWHVQKMTSFAIGSNLSNLDEFATIILSNLNKSSNSGGSLIMSLIEGVEQLDCPNG